MLWMKPLARDPYALYRELNVPLTKRIPIQKLKTAQASSDPYTRMRGYLCENKYFREDQELKRRNSNG